MGLSRRTDGVTDDLPRELRLHREARPHHGRCVRRVHLRLPHWGAVHRVRDDARPGCGRTFFWNGIPASVVGVAIAAFGITGVGGDEVMAYNYWLLEKGYAARTGPKDDTPEWNRRARGWIRVMYWDAFLSMLVYTFMTVAFYLLARPFSMRRASSRRDSRRSRPSRGLYTDSLGSWAEVSFLIGAFFVLFFDPVFRARGLEPAVFGRLQFGGVDQLPRSRFPRPVDRVLRLFLPRSLGRAVLFLQGSGLHGALAAGPSPRPSCFSSSSGRSTSATAGFRHRCGRPCSTTSGSGSACSRSSSWPSSP